MEEPLNTLIYKRTHTGDPDKSGIFGIHDCMGRVRSWPFDAVIGVGGKSPDPGSEDIAGRINWVGIGPTRKVQPRSNSRGPVVTFDHFVFLEETGPYLEQFAPNLFRHI